MGSVRVWRVRRVRGVFLYGKCYSQSKEFFYEVGVWRGWEECSLIISSGLFFSLKRDL